MLHVPMSLANLEPVYFKEFLDVQDGLLSPLGECVVLFGALTAGSLYLLHRTTRSAADRRRLSIAFMGTMALHLLSMGLSRGFNLDRKHAYVPQMWLLSLVGVLIGAAILFTSRVGLSPSSGITRSDSGPHQNFKSTAVLTTPRCSQACTDRVRHRVRPATSRPRTRPADGGWNERG